MIRPLAAFLLAGALTLSLSACGKQGTLERPAPLWGAKREQYQAEQRAKAEQQNLKPGESAPPVMPPRSAPMPGAKPDPSQSAPPGVLPDPYARPQ
ncbi:MAG TPA: hypothetical protein VFE03_14785 [Caulobacteraceae bacterium]|jgi:predicted small lipoprotein YifL|nr:hypothetical protein [Caulobacteraceae bacterium]